MQKYTIVIAIVTLLLGFGFGFVTGKNKVPSITMDHSSMSMSDTMASMNAGLKGKTGDEFDMAFLSEMIVHHEGAVEMAELALTNAKHKEVKDLATAIIAAQNTEIGQMKTWQKDWYNW